MTTPVSSEAASRPPIWAVVVGGGSGSRFGSAKQFELVCGESVFVWSIRALRPFVDRVVAVVPDAAMAPASVYEHSDAVVSGGATRAESVRAGLAAIDDAASWVLVHDAARPCCLGSVVVGVIDALARGCRAVVPVVEVTDTIKCVAPDGGLTTLDRSSLRAAQTPQAFVLADLAAAYEAASSKGAEATDDGSVMEMADATVCSVVGDPGNIKVTHRSDLAAVAAWLAVHRSSEVS